MAISAKGLKTSENNDEEGASWTDIGKYAYKGMLENDAWT